MKFDKKELNDHQVELIAEIDADQFENAKRKAARRISRNSKIPGFRPGKAPYDIIKRTFGDEAIEETAIDLLINETYPVLIEQSEIKPYGPGKLEEIISKEPLKFRFSVPLEPTVELGGYQEIKMPYKLPSVKPAEITKVLSNLQLKYATAEPVERAAQKGDLVAVKISAVLSKPDKEQEAEILKSTPHQLIIGEESESEEDQFPFSGFGEQLIDLKAGESKSFKHKYAKDSIYEKLRGKEANFSVEVDSVKNMAKPSLDDDFAKTLGVPGFDELKSSIKEQLETNKRNEYDNQYYDDLLEKIVKSSKIKYPPQMLDDEIQDVLKNIEDDLANQNLDLDTYLKLNKREKDEFIEKDVKPAAQKRLAHALVIEEISRQEKVELDQEELRQEFSRSFVQMQSAPNFKDLQKEFTTKNLSNMVVMQAATRLRNRRTLEKLKAIVTGEAETPAENESKPDDDKKESKADEKSEAKEN